ncbi:MAG TPA: hypothetical protein RMH99_27840 [Sandaracinaceae bacterium LLY-WYZ-13_1]|nr:hypothetical protein [Sandaracinaceae bacterium LLY-WYZ-13_1]
MAVLVPSTSPARARELRLDYRVPEGADCPGAEAFVDLVRARLGSTPFADDAAAVLRVTVRLDPLRAEVGWRDAGGVLLGRRTIEGTRCASMMETVAVVASLAVEEAEAVEGTTASDPEPEPRVIVRVVERDPERPPALTSEAAPPREEPPLRVRFALSAGGSYGPGPTPLLDVALGGGVRWDELGVLLSLHYADSLVSGGVSTDASLHLRLLRARVDLCWMPAPLALCGTTSVGMLEGTPSGVREPRPGRVAVATAGALVGAFWMLDPHAGIDVHAELATLLPTVTFRVGADELWTTAPVYGALHVRFLTEL